MGGAGRPPYPPNARDAPAEPWRPSTSRDAAAGVTGACAG
jgi:hypothetical protein